MKNYKNYLFLWCAFVLISCINKVPETNKNTKDTSSTKKTLKISNKAISEKANHSELYNVKLVGVTKDSIIANRYFIDFSSACMCSAVSFLLKKDKIYIFDYCQDALPPKSEEPYYIYNIIQQSQSENELHLVVANDSNNSLKLKFSKLDDDYIYKLTLEGDLPRDYIGVIVNNYYTFSPTHFDIYDCEGFEG